MEDLVFSTLPIPEAIKIIENEIKITPTVIILLYGDRISCCDEAAIVRTKNGDLVGIATISQIGQFFDGKPEIVGFYIQPRFRGKKISKPLLEKTINRCFERNLKPIYITVLSSRLIRVIEKLPAEMKESLKVDDQTILVELLKFSLE